MNIIEAIKSGKRFKMTYPVDNTYGNISILDLNGMIKLPLENGSQFHLELKTLAMAECHFEEEKIEITRNQLDRAAEIAFNDFQTLYPNKHGQIARKVILAKELGFKS